MDGFALNRLQGALLAEAFRLVADDVISPADLDALVKHGLGLRWSFMGPLETIDLNAPGGLAGLLRALRAAVREMQQQMTPREWDATLIDKLQAARRAELPANMQGVRQEWRDRRLMALLAHKARTAGVTGLPRWLDVCGWLQVAIERAAIQQRGRQW